MHQVDVASLGDRGEPVRTSGRQPPPRKPRRLLLNPNPQVTHLDLDGKPAVRVALSGTLGEGSSMILDAEDWPRVVETWGAAWGLSEAIPGTGYLYVCAGRRCRGEHEKEGSRLRAILARLLMGAAPGSVVAFVNGDRLDLRRSNLRLMTRAEAAVFRAEPVAAAGAG